MSIKVFFCYAHEDEELLSKLRGYLQPLQGQQFITMWDDRDISAGAERNQSISAHLNAAQVILVLISPSFMSSVYYDSFEMAQIIERHKHGEVRVVPILLRPALWENTPLHELRFLPTDGKPVTGRRHPEKALFNVANEISKMVQELYGPPQTKKDNVKTSSATTQPLEGAQSKQSTNSQITQVFHGQAQGVAAGGVNTFNIVNNVLPVEDLIVKGRSNAKQGYNALLRKNYSDAQRYLEAAHTTLSEEKASAETAQANYYMALALLGGERPFRMKLTTIQRIEQILQSAIDLQALHSYYYTLALFKRDFARNGLPQYRNDAQKLAAKARRLPLTEADKENLKLLTQCQPRLIRDSQDWKEVYIPQVHTQQKKESK